MAEFDDRALRDAMSNFCTGVVVATSVFEGAPVGFAAQSFISLSLDPPLVALCPAKTSSSWPKISASGQFGINILSASQKSICEAMAQSGGDKFAAFDWVRGNTGVPIFTGIIGCVECALIAEYEAGDHIIAVGAVKDFQILDESAAPLLFFRGAYGAISGQTEP